MTAQFTDTIRYRRHAFSLIGINAEGLVTPEQFGMQPEMMHTACYRGFYATYSLTKRGLLLSEFSVRDKNDYYPAIEGVEPTHEDFCATYTGLKIPVPFTGEIRIAKDFIHELYIHMGYQKASAFETVLDITMVDGRIAEVKDRSEDMAMKRGAFKERYETGGLLQTTAEAFTLDMFLE